MTLEELLEHPERAKTVPPEELPDLLAELRRIEVTLQLRLNSPNGHAPPSTSPKEKWLNTKEAADRLDVDNRWLYRHASKLPFARRISRKKLLFSEAGLNRWLKKNKA